MNLFLNFLLWTIKSSKRNVFVQFGSISIWILYVSFVINFFIVSTWNNILNYKFIQENLFAKQNNFAGIFF